MSDHTLTFTDNSFDNDVLSGDLPVLVDFWAPWCSTCVALGPPVDEVASRFAGRARVGKLNVDSNLETVARLKILGLPAVMVFRGGQLVEQRLGSLGLRDLVEMLEAATASPELT